MTSILQSECRSLVSTISITAVPLLLSACTMSGLGGSSEYGCKAPAGVQCDSVSGNYYNAIQNNLPAQRHAKSDMKSATAASIYSSSSTDHVRQAVATNGLSAAPLRSQARVLRLWFKPWEDNDHDLYDQGFVYIQVDSGNWEIDHMQQSIRNAYAPIRPPLQSSTTAPATEAATSGPASVQRPALPSAIPNQPGIPSIALPEQPSGERP